MNPFLGAGNYDAAGLPAEEEIARKVIYKIMPDLRNLLAQVRDLSAAWNTPANNIPEKIKEAHAAGEPLAGFDPHAWDEWGQTFLGIMTMIEVSATIYYSTNPQTTAQKSAAEVVATRYTPVQG